MRFTNQLTSLSLIFAVSACGVKNEDKNSVAPATQTSVEQPATAIVRVPVDANGAPAGEPEMRLIAEAKELNSNESVEAAFAEGKAPEKLVESEAELDGDTSTQAWGCWSRSYTTYYAPSYGYSSYGYSNYGYNSYNTYGSNYWASSYRPALYSGGNSYGYNYGGSYGYGNGNYNGGYSYYTYNRGY